MPATPPFKSALLESAGAFLSEALENHRNRRVRFAIVHAVTAAELALKERLVRISPVIICRNIDAKDPRREQSVALSILPQRLTNLGIALAPKDATLIATFADWRNEIIHHMPSFDEKHAHHQLPQLLDFLARFLRTELGTPLESFLPKHLYRVAAALLKDWQIAVEAAQGRAAADAMLLRDACPQCGVTGTMSAREDNTRAFCHLCDSPFYRHLHCDGCGRETLNQHPSKSMDNYCDNCIAEAGDRYISMMIDLDRGK